MIRLFPTESTPVRAALARSAAPRKPWARRSRTAQLGASLLEAIAYLGIAAVVVLGAVSLLNGAFGSAKSNQTNEEVVALRTAIRKLYIGQSYPAASLVPDLIVANAVPATLARNGDGTALSNSWGGAVTIVGTTTGFNIVYAGVPQDVCVNVVSGASGWTSIAQGTAVLTTFPVTVAQAATLCSVTGAAGNSVTFTAS